MKNLLVVVIGLSLYLLSTQAVSMAKESLFIPTSDCVFSCVESKIVGNNWYFFVKGADGSPINIIASSVASTAELVSSTILVAPSNNKSSVIRSTTADMNLETIRYVYETPTEMIVIYVTIMRDGQGNIIDVQSEEKRFQKPDDQQEK